MLWIYFLLMPVKVHANVTSPPENIISPCTDKYHMFLAPGVLTAGGSNRACLSRFYPEGPARLLLTLVTEDRQLIIANRDLPPGDGGCLDISAPLQPNTKAELIVTLRYLEAQCTWERRMTVRISSGRVVLVHTERARYRPGDTLRFRVYSFKADLSPALENIDEIWVEGPRGAWEGTRVMQWTRVRTRMGLVQLQYDLDELAPAGRWSVRARLEDGSQGTAAFMVGNYELPPFQLSVKHAPRVLRTSDRLVWTVCVRYPWMEAVEGMLVIRLRGAGNSGSHSGIRTAVRIRAPRACHRHAAASRRIGLDGLTPPDVIIADFSFQEEGTRMWQNTTVMSKVVDKAISLEFLTKHRAVISPGLPYKLKVQAMRWDDKPATNERVIACRHAATVAQLSQDTNNGAVCVSADTDDTGIARLMFAPGDDVAPYYRFEAHLGNDSNITAAPLTLPVHRSAVYQAALGPLKADSLVTRTFVPLYLHLPNITTAITVHFVVITRGGIIYRWGVTTQCPISSSANQIQTAPRHSKCSHIPLYSVNPLYRSSGNAANYTDIDNNAPENYKRTRLSYKNYPNLHKYMMNNATKRVRYDSRVTRRLGKRTGNVENAVDSLLDRHLVRVMLPIKVTHQMCPDSHLVAYFYHNGELVSASKHFEMDECFANKVEASWVTRQTLPGSIASLQVSTSGPALCALTALDTASKWYSAPVTVKEVLMNSLRRLIEAHRNLTEYDAAGDCFLNLENPDAPSSGMELTSSWLAAAGVRVLGDVTPRHCSTSPMPLITHEGIVPRSDFSESWMWRILPVNATGTAVASSIAPDSITRFEAGVLCVSKNGVALSPPALLQVFREFFIHADVPRQLRRGDSTVIRYRIFNYLYEPLSIQIEVVSDSHFDSISKSFESSCIAARSSLARRAELLARTPGLGRINIRAKVLNNGACGMSSARNVSDEVVIQVTIDPEGVPVHEHKSVMLCGRGGKESSKSQVSWSWPPAQTVPGTESLTVWATGDPTGPLLANADALVLLPRGCGEQNMARLATNLLALSVLDPRSAAASTAREHVARGFTRQLQYIHPSGGFSAFGSSDAVPSTWLTAFAIRYLRRAHQVLWPGLPTPPALERAEKWLLGQQMENGCFRNEGQVFHRELKGGLNEDGEVASVALTAYVITSIVDSTSPLSARVIRNTLSCLRALPPSASRSSSRVYGHALLAYAFMRLKRYEEELRRTNEASLLWERRKYIGNNLEKDEEIRELMDLIKMGKRNDDYMWWETSSLSTSIEATSYALLALRDAPAPLQDLGRTALLWLGAQRTATGGFVSTQDTLVALEALTAWSSLQSQTLTDLTVTIQSNQEIKTVKLRPGVKIPDVMKMGTGDKINVVVEGDGCALVQATRSYNTLIASNSDEKPLVVQVAVHTDGPFDCDANETYCFCAAIVETCVVWTGAFPEMALLEVSLPGGYGVDASRLYSQLQNSDTLLRRIELSSNSGKVTMYLGAGQWGERSGRHDAPAHQCYRLHAVGPVARTRPAFVRLQDYYRPALNDTQTYTIPEDCPARVSHENNGYHASDNLFSKAKSLSDSGEILITDEFSFEDIPEGIPLDDPLYENLTRMDKVTNDADTDEIIKKVQNIIKKQLESMNNKTTISDTSEERNEGFNESKEVLERWNEISKDVNETDTNFINSTNDFRKHLEENIETIREESYIPFEDKTRNPVERQRNDIPIKDDNIIKTDKHNIETREEHLNNDQNETDNPKLADFHVIDSEKDLDVPSGVEGPVPVVVPPPKDFVLPTQIFTDAIQNGRLSKAFSERYYFPEYNIRNVRFSRSTA